MAKIVFVRETGGGGGGAPIRRKFEERQQNNGLIREALRVVYFVALSPKPRMPIFVYCIFVGCRLRLMLLLATGWSLLPRLIRTETCLAAAAAHTQCFLMDCRFFAPFLLHSGNNDDLQNTTKDCSAKASD